MVDEVAYTPLCFKLAHKLNYCLIAGVFKPKRINMKHFLSCCWTRGV